MLMEGSKSLDQKSTDDRVSERAESVNNRSMINDDAKSEIDEILTNMEKFVYDVKVRSGAASVVSETSSYTSTANRDQSNSNNNYAESCASRASASLSETGSLKNKLLQIMKARQGRKDEENNADSPQTNPEQKPQSFPNKEPGTSGPLAMCRADKTDKADVKDSPTLFFVEFYNVRIPCDRRMYVSTNERAFKTILFDIITEARGMFKSAKQEYKLPELGGLACMYDGSIVAVTTLRALQTMMLNKITSFTPVFTEVFANTDTIVKLTNLWSIHGLYISREVLRRWVMLKTSTAEEFSSTIIRNLLEYVVKGARPGDTGFELIQFIDIFPRDLTERQLKAFFKDFIGIVSRVQIRTESKKMMVNFICFLEEAVLSSDTRKGVKKEGSST